MFELIIGESLRVRPRLGRVDGGTEVFTFSTAEDGLSAFDAVSAAMDLAFADRLPDAVLLERSPKTGAVRFIAGPGS